MDKIINFNYLSLKRFFRQSYIMTITSITHSLFVNSLISYSINQYWDTLYLYACMRCSCKTRQQKIFTYLLSAHCTCQNSTLLNNVYSTRKCCLPRLSIVNYSEGITERAREHTFFLYARYNGVGNIWDKVLIFSLS